MEIFVGNLPTDVTERELQQFFKGYDKQASFQLIKLIGSKASSYYGLVNIPADKLALKAIHKLKNKTLGGQAVVVREFQYRAGNNDRRALNWRNLTWQKVERRLGERRQRQEEICEYEPVYTAYENLASRGF